MPRPGYLDYDDGPKADDHMSMVTLMSGGLDSTLMAVLAASQGVAQFPLFIDYGQLGRERELMACRTNCARYKLPAPIVAELSGYGALLSSGLTDPKKHIVRDAFLPGRNLLFVTLAGAYAHQVGAHTIGIGLLHEAFSLFPDQTKVFLAEAQQVVTRATGRDIKIVAPLMSFSKKEIVAMAASEGIEGTYSCHAGGETPCGACISCREFLVEGE